MRVQILILKPTDVDIRYIISCTMYLYGSRNIIYMSSVSINVYSRHLHVYVARSASVGCTSGGVSAHRLRDDSRKTRLDPIYLFIYDRLVRPVVWEVPRSPNEREFTVLRQF